MMLRRLQGEQPEHHEQPPKEPASDYHAPPGPVPMDIDQLVELQRQHGVQLTTMEQEHGDRLTSLERYMARLFNHFHIAPPSRYDPPTMPPQFPGDADS